MIAALAEAADAAGATYCGTAGFDNSGAVTSCGYMYLDGAKSDIRETDTGVESWAWYDTYPWGQHPDDPAPEPEEPEECLEGEECETDEWSLSVRVQATGFAAAAMVVINI